MADRPRVCVGAIAGAHGVRGLVRLKSFTEVPEAVASYGPLENEAGGRRFAVTLQSASKGQFIAHIQGVNDREAAEALRGVRLYVDRSVLPPPDEPDDFYYADLIGLRVETADGAPFGKVRAVEDFGAGDVIEIEREDGDDIVLPFTRAVFPVVDIEGERLVVDPPPDLGESKP
ncbi:MAG: ribosome maturation factor RimM [Pseudomonadota bacterium]